MPLPDRRADILDRLADHVLAEGLAAASLRPLARAAGTSDRMLLYYFPDKAALMAATLSHLAARLQAILAAATAAPQPLEVARAEIWAAVQAPAIWPYMRLWLEIVARAAQGDAFCAEVGGGIARGYLEWCETRLAVADPMARRVQAAALLISIEGMLVLRSVGLGDACALLVGQPQA